MNHSWIVCQLGAREHYAIPRVLHQLGGLGGLYTDLWAPPNAFWRRLPVARLRERYHSQLADGLVVSQNFSYLSHEIGLRLKKHRGWAGILERNAWFQSQVVRSLAQRSWDATPKILFSYSYTALAPFRYAKERGWKTVLGQIDPAIIESQLLQRLGEADSPPESYWQHWHQEWAIADVIVVNSQWSRQALRQVQVPDEKIRVIPLAYEPLQGAAPKIYPDAFSGDRPLRILFLGQINRRKGILPLLESLSSLHTPFWELWLVGTVTIPIPELWQHHPQVRWFGSIPRQDTARFYQQADVFILPTYSDGFALTQLEAQAWHLPVIASPFCGDVVRDGENGILLTEVSSGAIAQALNRCLDDPGMLAEQSARSRSADFSLAHLAQHLATLDHDLS